MLKTIMGLMISIFSMALYAQAVNPIYVVHVNLGNTQLSQNVVEEFLRPNPHFKNRPVILLRPNIDTKINPFAVSHWGLQTGLTRQNNQINDQMTPLLTPEMTTWFEDLEKKNIHPEVFIVNGHHLVGMGFQSDETWETSYKNKDGQTIELANRALYFKSLVKSKDKYPVLKRFFDNIKLAFIGGCEGLTNLEPKEFGLSGRALTPEEIKFKYENGQKNLMLGDIAQGTGLLGYRTDLVRVYPGDYTDTVEDEVCVDMVNRLNCEVHDVNRILPDSGLWDGSHAYNMPYQMKKLFSNAYAVFGFNTPSPRHTGAIWKATFNEARAKLKLNNSFQLLLSAEIPQAEKKQIIQQTRIAWTKSTQKMNRRYRAGKVINRISGSITPAFPELDENGIFAYEDKNKAFSEAPAFAPYEVRSYKPTESEDPLFHLIQKLKK